MTVWPADEPRRAFDRNFVDDVAVSVQPSAPEPTHSASGSADPAPATGLLQAERTALWGYVATACLSIAAAQVTAILACVTWVVRMCRHQAWRGVAWPLIGPRLAWTFVSALAAWAAVDPTVGWIELRSGWLGAALFYVVVHQGSLGKRGQRGQRGQRGCQATLWVQTLAAVGALAALVAMGQVVREGLAFRATGPLGHYITFGHVLMVIFVLTVAQLVFQDSEASQASARSPRLWLMVAAVVQLGGLVATQARGPVLGLVAGCGILFVLSRRRLLIALPVLLALLALANESFRNRFLDLVSLRDITATERLYMWRGAWGMIIEYPLTGVGPGNARQLFDDYKLPDDPWLPERRLAHLHNNLVQIVAERGVLGLAAWCWLFVVFFRDGWRRYRQLRRRGREPATGPRGTAGAVSAGPAVGAQLALVGGSGAALVGFLVAGLTDYSYGDTEVFLLVSFTMGLLYATDQLR